MIPKITTKGFTLIELMVAVSIFVIVAMITTGAFVTANEVNKKAQAVRLVMDNLNFALDSMSLKIRKGGTFYCSNDPLPDSFPTGLPVGCAPGSTLSFITASGQFPVPTGGDKYFSYSLENNRIYYKAGSDVNDFRNAPKQQITMNEAVIEDLEFSAYNVDTGSGQPIVSVVVSGVVKIGRQESRFTLQTAASKR